MLLQHFFYWHRVLFCWSNSGLVIYGVLDRSLFQIFQRFLLRKVCLLNIVPYMSESGKLPVTSRTFGLGGCEVIMMSLEPQKLVFLLWAQSKVMETLVMDIFSWETFKATFSIKINNTVTSHNSKWWLVTLWNLENTLF